MTLLAVYAALTVGISFVCSLLEAALLSIPSAALTPEPEKEGAAKQVVQKRGVQLLHNLKTERLDDALSAILTLNTIANTLGAVLVGAQAESWARAYFEGDDAATYISISSAATAGLLTLLILSCSEIIPKTLGAVHARSLANFVGLTVNLLTKILVPALVLTRALTRTITRNKQNEVSRGELRALIGLASQGGLMEQHESDVYRNMLDFHRILVGDVMTPRTVTVMTPVDTTLSEILDARSTKSFSRIPVYGENRDDILGYVLQTELLRAAWQGANMQKTVRSFLRPVWFIPEVANMGQALREFQSHRDPLAMVADEHGGVSGIITHEDVIETILGVEIVDESDRVEDLRELASQVRERRIQRLIERHELQPEEDPNSP